MINLTFQEAATLLGLTTPHQGSFTGFSIDTRTLKPGNLFIALPGENVDGHDYIPAAEKAGAAAILASRACETKLPVFIVQDATLALGKLAKAWRHRFHIPFIAVTGSNGKTTTKNMIASIFTAACDNHPDHVLATLGTLNNHWGLPLTLGRLNAEHHYAVIEMGMNHFGEIDYLSRLTEPNIALITNAGPSHLEGVGDLAGVARAKAEIFNGLVPGGMAILNRDDHFYDQWASQVKQHLSFGLHASADVRADITLLNNQQQLNITTPKGNINITLPLLGKHNALNALAATAAALSAGIDLKHIKMGLEAVAPASGRMQVHTLNGMTIIDDTYNANPLSLQAAVDTLANFEGKKIVVLGDMKELGQDAANLHETAGENMRSAGIDYLFTLGELTQHTSKAFGEKAQHFNEANALITALKPLLNNNTTILVKGSRSMHMEKVIASLVA
ncbi:MAG TPA: UDP-N-acetylmuramoyl-tripeptide--D-alanyl-D-alanine ligase [Gammaproteobacteria bacterium]|nr:UDP-N-acetylmuramoyl-tripeptide--D-alanyl-D-alanine ligase [Gammaproteobacteria bacterium]